MKILIIKLTNGSLDQSHLCSINAFSLNWIVILSRQSPGLLGLGIADSFILNPLPDWTES